MKTIFAYDPWRLVENELHKDDMRLSESMTSIGNGHMGMRGNFEAVSYTHLRAHET